MKVSIWCRADGEPVITSPSVEDGNENMVPIQADYICWEWHRGEKPRVIIGVDADSLTVQADVNFPGDMPPPIIK